MAALNSQIVPTLMRLGRSTADDASNIGESGKPVFIECGCCGGYHPENFHGECRDNDNRFAPDKLDEKYGSEVWEEISLDEQMENE